MANKSCMKNRIKAHEEDRIKDVLYRLANTAQKQREQLQTHFQPVRGRKSGDESNLSEALPYCVRERIQQRKQAAVS